MTIKYGQLIISAVLGVMCKRSLVHRMSNRTASVLRSASSFAAMMTKWRLSIAMILGTLVCRVGADFPCKTEQIHWKSNSTLGKRYKCLECPDCPAGSQPSVPCGSSVPYHTPIHCVPCQLSKTYSNRYDKAQCKACTVCSPGKAVVKNCTLLSNTECDDKCAHGYYSVPFIFTCLPCTECCKNGKDELAKECKNYGKKCKVPSTPCRRVNTTPSTTVTTVSQRTSTALQTTHQEKHTSSVTPTLSGNTRQVDARVKSEEDNGETKTLMTLAIVGAIIGILAILALIAFIVCGGRITNDCFRCRWNRNSNTFDGMEAPTAVAVPAHTSTTASPEQRNKDDMNLEWLEDNHLDVFEQMCLMLDNGRWRCSRYYERLASKYKIIRLEVRNALRDELQVEGGSPSRLLMSHLKVSYPNLPIRHLIHSLKEIGRNDIAQLLMSSLRQNGSAIPGASNQ